MNPWAARIFPLGPLLLAGIIAGGLFSEGYARYDLWRAGAFFACGLAGAWACVMVALEEKLRLGSALLILTGMVGWFVAWGAVYLVPLPPAAAAALSPMLGEAAAAAHAAGIPLGGWRPLALSPENTLDALHQSIAMLCFVAAAGVVSLHDWGEYWVPRGVAAFAMLQGLAGLWSVGMEGAERAHGALFNPGHFAASVMLGLPLAIALVLYSPRERPNDGDPDALVRNDRQLLLMGVIALAAIGWILSLSRGAVGAGLVMLLLWGGGEWQATRRRHHGSRLLLRSVPAVACAGLAVVVIMALATPAVEARLSDADMALQGRAALWHHTLKGASQGCFLGVGPGGTEYLLNGLASFGSTAKRAVWAHNDLVQLLADLGIIGLAGLLLLAVFFSRSVVAGVRRWEHHSWKRWLRVRAAGAGLVAILLQSLFDFPLRVPLAAFLFLLLAAWLAAQIQREVLRPKLEKNRLRPGNPAAAQP